MVTLSPPRDGDRKRYANDATRTRDRLGPTVAGGAAHRRRLTFHRARYTEAVRLPVAVPPAAGNVRTDLVRRHARDLRRPAVAHRPLHSPRRLRGQRDRKSTRLNSRPT